MIMGIVYLSIIGLGVIAGIVSGVYIHRQMKKSPPHDLFDEEPPAIVVEKAVVLEKSLAKQMTGSYQVPGHFIRNIVVFSTEGGSEKKLDVSSEDYDKLEVGAKGNLICQNTRFLGFEPIE